MAETVALAAMAGGTLLSAGGAIQSGNAQRRSANFQATQMRQQASAELATSQRQAIEARREAILTQSRAQTVAASGGSSGDLGVTNLLADIGQVGEYNALSALFSGKERAASLITGANAQVIQGRQAAKASKIQAAATILEGAGQMGQYKSMAAKYNPASMSSPVGQASNKTPWGATWMGS